MCLSLLGTWVGEAWSADVSNLNQVLLSIFAMIFVEDPFYNEPGYQSMRGTPEGDERSKRYSADVRYHTLHHAVYDVLMEAGRGDSDDDGGSGSGGSGSDTTLHRAAYAHFAELWPVLQIEYLRWAHEESDPRRAAEMEEWVADCSNVLKKGR